MWRVGLSKWKFLIESGDAFAGLVDPMAGGSVSLSDASIGALTAALTLLIVTLSVAVVLVRVFVRRRRERARHKSRDYGKYINIYMAKTTVSRLHDEANMKQT